MGVVSGMDAGRMGCRVVTTQASATKRLRKSPQDSTGRSFQQMAKVNTQAATSEVLG
jgi:hypothetical protein